MRRLLPERGPRAIYQDQDEWQVRCWCPDPAHFYWITNAARFRQTMHDGLIPDMPRGALG